MASVEDVVRWLQEDFRGEQQAAHQYLLGHWRVRGLLRPVYRELFRKFAIEEMRHLDELGEWLVRFGEVPDLMHPLAVEDSEQAHAFVDRSLELEEQTVTRYIQRVQALSGTEFEDLSQLYQRLLDDEAEHRNELLQMQFQMGMGGD